MPKGFVNIQKAVFGRRIGYYTGGDIHATLESAQSVADKNTIAQATIEYTVKGEQECKSAHNVESTSSTSVTDAPTVEVKSRANGRRRRST